MAVAAWRADDLLLAVGSSPGFDLMSLPHLPTTHGSAIEMASAYFAERESEKSENPGDQERAVVFRARLPLRVRRRRDAGAGRVMATLLERYHPELWNLNPENPRERATLEDGYQRLETQLARQNKLVEGDSYTLGMFR